MKINEIVQVSEIERIPASDFRGGKNALSASRPGEQVRKLPGGSGLLYSTEDNRYGIVIKLWDPAGKNYTASQEREKRSLPGQLIGRLSVVEATGFPSKGAVRVETITVDEDYRGVGIGKSLYGIVLTILKRPLLAGSMQTPGGRRSWVSLAGIPGVELKGYFVITSSDLDVDQKPRDIRGRRKNKNAETAIDTIMGKLGGQHLGKSAGGNDYFSFDVQPNTTGKELEAHVKQKLVTIYGNTPSIAYGNGLYAVWTGAQ